MKTFLSETINTTIPFIQNELDEKIILEIMRSVLKIQRLWISVEKGLCNTVKVRIQQNIFLAELVVISLYWRVSLVKLPQASHGHIAEYIFASFCGIPGSYSISITLSINLF